MPGKRYHCRIVGVRNRRRGRGEGEESGGERGRGTR